MSEKIYVVQKVNRETSKKICQNCGATIQQWLRPEAQSPDAIAMLKGIELMGTVAGHHPPHVCPNCNHYWWFNENQIEDNEWPEEW